MVDYNVPFSGGRITITSQAAADYLSQQGEINVVAVAYRHGAGGAYRAAGFRKSSQDRDH